MTWSRLHNQKSSRESGGSLCQILASCSVERSWWFRSVRERFLLSICKLLYPLIWVCQRLGLQILNPLSNEKRNLISKLGKFLPNVFVTFSDLIGNSLSKALLIGKDWICEFCDEFYPFLDCQLFPFFLLFGDLIDSFNDRIIMNVGFIGNELLIERIDEVWNFWKPKDIHLS